MTMTCIQNPIHHQNINTNLACWNITNYLLIVAKPQIQKNSLHFPSSDKCIINASSEHHTNNPIINLHCMNHGQWNQTVVLLCHRMAAGLLAEYTAEHPETRCRPACRTAPSESLPVPCNVPFQYNLYHPSTAYVSFNLTSLHYSHPITMHSKDILASICSIKIKLWQKL